MAVTVIMDKERLVKEMDREMREEKRKDNMVEILDRQNKLKNEILRRKIIDEGRIDLLATEVLGYKLWDFHKEIMAFQYGKLKSLVLAPRDSGKSTILHYTKVIYEILRNPDIRIAIVSNTQIQAEGFLKEIRNHLEANTKLIEVFGSQVGKKWDTKEIIVKGRQSKHKESTITCIGVGSALVGKHFDMVVGDDLVDEEASRTELQRERQRTWFYQTLYPTMEPDSQLHLIGTRYHYLDLWGHFIGDTEYEGAGEFKDCYHRVKALTEDENGDLKSFWIEKFSIKRLLEMRRNMGTILFNAQMQNDTKAMKGAVIKDEYFRYYEKLPIGLKILTGVDLAISSSKKANKFAKVTLGMDVKQNLYVMNYYERRALTPKEQKKKIIEDAKTEFPHSIGIESNAYQESVAIDVKMEEPGLNIKKIYTAIDKKSKGWKVSALFEAGRVYITNEMRRFKDHMLLFDGEDGGDDDLFDAFYNACELALWRKNKKTRKEPGLI